MGNISINGGATTQLYVTNTHPKLGGQENRIISVRTHRPIQNNNNIIVLKNEPIETPNQVKVRCAPPPSKG
jgi:hypothetical protein